ncbi:hypothetical protein RHMOL_Rhmol12G0139500 [Rhododendron molle]|uniref:Uncharacterized protein n=1 Tax=Rhododendron molle TaxID=49168 RepID=A0ACC0LI51_RHOML|nr:hypothetical protein RHMOL_Rhmol12G0139500 [Rhododendron molle]
MLCFPDLSPSLEKHENNVDSYPNYGNQSNVGDDVYEKYDQLNVGNDGFKYDKSSPANAFKYDSPANAFKYDSPANAFKYDKSSTSSMGMMMDGKVTSKWVQPGKFFRERMLKAGTIMPMPDIKDKMPKRSFLPRVISSKLPFSTSKIVEMKKIFHARENSSMLAAAVSECERAPSTGETKRCVGSVEDMIDFAISMLGRNMVVRTTENNKGSKNDVMIETVSGINVGRVTKSVSCHQSLFPYLLYYCHSVPKVQVYEANILDPKTKVKINHRVAICHVDTSSWEAGHEAFMALSSSPGKIKVCHWIFENDMTWTTAD